METKKLDLSKDNMMEHFLEPSIICICGDINTCKSNLLYHLITEFKNFGKFNLYTYGLRNKIDNAIEVYSVEEIEQIQNSIIVIDEIMSLWDFSNRKEKRQIEKTLRLLNHNNNVILLSAIPENLVKFISGKINKYFFSKSTITDFINGSRAKQIVTNYRGVELGTNILNIQKGDTLFFDGLHYYMYNVPYYKKYDTKKGNVPIIVPKSVLKNVPENVQKDVESPKMPLILEDNEILQL